MVILKSKKFLQEFHYSEKTAKETSSIYKNQKDKDEVSDEIELKLNYVEKIACYIVWFEETRAQAGMLELLRNLMEEKNLVMASKAQLGLFKPSRLERILFRMKRITKVGIIPDDITKLQKVSIFKENNCSVKNIIGKEPVEKLNAYPFLMDKVAILLVKEKKKHHFKKEEPVRNVNTEGVKSSHQNPRPKTEHKKVLHHQES